MADRLHAAASLLKAGFGVSFGVYLLVKLAGVFVDVPQATELTILPAGMCALGLAAGSRRATASERAAAEEAEGQAVWPGLVAGVALAVFTAVYLVVNTVPMITSQDEFAIVNGAHELATDGSLRVMSPWNERYDTNIIGALHVMYRTPTEMYYRAFPGTAVIFAPFSLLPGGSGVYLFAAVVGTLAALALYAVAWKVLESWQAGLVAALLFVTSPAFGHWAVTVFNNVSAVSLVLGALAAVLWADKGRAWPFAIAGALIGIAGFVRVTELVFAAPLVVLVWWRVRTWRGPAAFACASLMGVVLILAANWIFYGAALFSPYAGDGYLFQPIAQQGAPPVAAEGRPAAELIERYALFSLGTKGSFSNFDSGQKLENVVFHVRYLGSSTFAFPFLSLAFAGVAWRLAAGRRNSWLLAAAIAVAAAAVLGLYGHQSHNYYGFGQPIVRTSFIRYSLLVYALLAVSAAAFFSDAAKAMRGRMHEAALPVALLGIALLVGVAQSYDWNVYGFNRLNEFREEDRDAWKEIKAFLDDRPRVPLVVVGPSAEKLIDRDYEPYAINTDTVPAPYRYPILLPVIEEVAAERQAYVITSDSTRDDQALRDVIFSTFLPREVLHAGLYRVHLVRLGQPKYELQGVDVWHTYQGFERWEPTAEGFLSTKGDYNYFQPLLPPDIDSDGSVDVAFTLQVELLDAGASEYEISGLDSRAEWQPVSLAHGSTGNTNTWKLVEIHVDQGARLRNEFIVSSGVTIRAIRIFATPTQG